LCYDLLRFSLCSGICAMRIALYHLYLNLYCLFHCEPCCQFSPPTYYDNSNTLKVLLLLLIIIIIIIGIVLVLLLFF
jgi:hypothetical protein